ncbi:MAG: PQQ-dependent sugar dehydrogenase, partial [Chloroflexi bacterium]|nr:PQQ-dependent sugar dehydrogenase [Chloroflexota bacterium]
FVEVREFRGEHDWWGKVRVVKDGKLEPTSLWEARVGDGNEQGLVGLALDPSFASNHYLYVYYTEGKSGSGSPSAGKLVRLTERDGRVVGQPVTLINDVEPGKCCHTGGKMVFDKDGMLILALGDQGDIDRRDAQKAEKFNGKVLRFDPNNLPRAAGDQGKKLSDPRSATIASGLRNPYGIDINPKNGVVYITDNGPDECDEINAVFHVGANFGNPTVECSPGDPTFVDPVWDSGPDRLAPTGMRFYQGAMFPEWQDDLLWCAFDTGNLTRFRLSPPEFDRVQTADQILSGAEQGGHGCRLDLTVARDGSIYFSSATSIFRLSR